MIKLSVYFGDAVTVGPRLAADVLMDRLAEHGVVCALLRGIEGFGLQRRLHAERFPDVSTDLPLLVIAVVREERIDALLDDVDASIPRGLVTLERVDAEVPGPAAELTVFCAGRRAHRTVAEVLRRCGAVGATVLAGVDGVLGRRRREGLFRSGGAPMVVVSVGPVEALRDALGLIRQALPDAVAMLAPVALLKHHGQYAERLPAADDWQAISVYSRRWTEAGGALLTRRLREAGAAGSTTVLGEWGFSGYEHPHGDRLGRVASHRPACTTAVDRAERVAEHWRIVDELTAEHGIVTAVSVPAYRERALRPIGPRFGSSP